MSIELYKEKIQELAEKRIDEMFFNVNAEHAMIVVTELMKNAENYVYVVGKNMDPTVTDNKEYLEAVEFFLKKENSKMKILLTNYDKEKFENSKIGKLLAKYMAEHKEIEIRHTEGKQIRREGGIPINFTVSDGRAYRFERDVNNHIAFGNFNDEKTATSLAKKFITFFEQGSVIS
ncbi:MAG: hypothetical protein FWC26_05485 [Fibromonadales bacterium]|nr:hypothetical protein [Fibromonadales bacterium]